MRCDILTLFPAALEPYLATGILGRAAARGVVDVRVHDLRRWAENRYGQVDDQGFGGGPGMVLLAPVVVRAVREVLGDHDPGGARVVIPDARGRRFDHGTALGFSRLKRLILVCGRYEGFDQRVFELVSAEAVSLGDFVLSGGELPALAILDAAARLIPGVVGDPASVVADSFVDGLLDHPVFTRPRSFEGLEVPDVLLSGDHAAVEKWRRRESVLATLRSRPDLIISNWRRYPDEVRSLIIRTAEEEGLQSVLRPRPQEAESGSDPSL